MEGILKLGEISFFNQVDFTKSFCYLGDRLNASGRSKAAVAVRARIGWIKFRECGKYFMGESSLKMEGRIRVA